MTSRQPARPCISMGQEISPLQPTAATTPCSLWSVWTRKEGYLLDLWRKQSASNEWVEAFCDLVIKWKPLGWAEEQGQIRAGIGPFLERRQRERNAFVARQAFPTRGDKAIRAQSIRGRMALEGLYVPVSAPWYPDFRAELLSFPAGRHDDQADALGLVGQLLDLMVKGSKPAPPKK